MGGARKSEGLAQGGERKGAGNQGSGEGQLFTLSCGVPAAPVEQHCPHLPGSDMKTPEPIWGHPPEWCS